MGVDTVEGYVGPQTAFDGTNIAIRQLRDGSVGVAEVHGRYYEQTYRAHTYTAAVFGQAITVAGTSMTGLILVNATSGINAVLQKTTGHITTTAASATSVGLAWFNSLNAFGSTTLTNLTPVSNKLGAGGGQIGAYSAVNSTNGTPVEFWPLLHNTAAIATTGEDNGWNVDFEGSIIVPPGFGVCLCTIGASATGNAALQWEEVPV